MIRSTMGEEDHGVGGAYSGRQGPQLRDYGTGARGRSDRSWWRGGLQLGEGGLLD